ncbi:MAG: hypothetical protein JNM70_24525, partial [Anaerolineae bacterium]|nr:hypothetical protein [Anaerolineae bacterium]
MPERVADQVLQHPLDQAEVGVHRRQAGRHVHGQPHARAFGGELELLHHVHGELGEREPLALQRHALEVELRQLEQLVDQRRQPLALLQGHAEVVLALRRRQRFALRRHQLEVAA